MLLSHGGSGALGFYAPYINCHTTVFSDAFWEDRLDKNGSNFTTLMGAVQTWTASVNSGNPYDLAWVEDTYWATDQLTWSNGIFGGGWNRDIGNCN